MKMNGKIVIGLVYLLYFDNTEYVILSLGNEFRVQYCIIKCKQLLLKNVCLVSKKYSHRPSFVLFLKECCVKANFLIFSREKQVGK